MHLHTISSRLAALGLLMIVVLLLVAAVIRPLWERYASNRDLISELESRLVRFEAISNRETQLEERLEKLKQRLERSGLMIEAESATLASALLQERVNNVVDETGGTLASTQVVVGQADGGFQRVSVNARMTGSVAEVQSSLYGLESTPPALVVDNLLIVTRRTPVRLRGQGDSIEELLDVRFQVTGFYDARAARN